MSRLLRAPSPERVASLGGVGFRLLGMGGRLVLTLYIGRYLGLDALASYGLVSAGSAVMVALTGVGVDYRLNRHAANDPLAGAVLRVRDRMVLRALIGAAVATPLAFILPAMGDAWMLPWTALAVLVGEPLVYDLQQALVFRGRPVLANALLCLRAGAWVPPVVALGILDPAQRSMEIVYLGWFASLAVPVILAVVWTLTTAELRPGMARPVDWRWLRRSGVDARYVYLSELGLVGAIYLDRYLVAAFAGAEAAGTFVFFWALTNAVVPLVQAGVFNQLTPALSRLWRAGDTAGWRTAFERGRARTLRIATALGVAVAGVLLALSPSMGVARGTETTVLILLMTAATIVRLAADMLHIALYSAGRDSDWAAVNILSLLLTPIVAVPTIFFFGLIGAGVQMLLVPAAVLVMRRRLLRHVFAAQRRNEASPPGRFV